MYKLVVGIVAASMAIAACGGSSNKSSTAGGTGGATTTSTGSGAGSSTTAGGGDGGGSISSDLAKAKIKITYSDTTVDDTGASSASTFTLALDGNGKSAFTNVDGTDPSAATTIYNTGTTTVECEGTGTTAHCTALPATGTSAATTFLQGFTAIGTIVATLGGGDKSSDTIAGRDASCVKYKAQDVIGRLSALPLFKDSTDKVSDYDANDTATICLDKKNGWVLKLDETKKGKPQGALLATAVGDPTDSDFTPPVTPVTVPSVPKVSIPNVSIPTAPTNPGQ